MESDAGIIRQLIGLMLGEVAKARTERALCRGERPDKIGNLVGNQRVTQCTTSEIVAHGIGRLSKFFARVS